MNEQPTTPRLIDVGANDADGDLRLWAARRALQQAEARLASQMQNVAALESWAASLGSWAFTASASLATALVVANTLPARTAAFVGLLGALGSSALVLVARRPRPWQMPQPYRPSEIMALSQPTELTESEATALALEPLIDINGAQLLTMSTTLRIAMGVLFATPALAVCGWILGRWAAYAWPALSAALMGAPA